MKKSMVKTTSLFMVIVISLIICLGINVIAVENTTEFAGGDGTQSNPYKVSTAVHLDNVRKYLNAHFIQIKNIDLSAATSMGGDYFNGGDGWIPIGNIGNAGATTSRFTGSYDGGNYTISGMKINGSGGDYTGLFAWIAGTVKNLNLSECNITSSAVYVGGISGGIRYALIDNCHVTGTVRATGSSAYIGGIVGLSDNVCKIINCSNFALLSGQYRVGGITGGIIECEGEIKNCYNHGQITSSTRNSQIFVGGIIGYKQSGLLNVANCNNLGEIMVSASSGTAWTAYTGGIMGYQYGSLTIENCINSGNITITATNQAPSYAGTAYTGGILGGSSNGELLLKQNYNNGAIGVRQATLLTSGPSANFYTAGIIGDLNKSVNSTFDMFIVGCFNLGNISTLNGNIYNANSFNNCGGIVAHLGYNVSVANCYNKGNLSAKGDTLYTRVGGIVGNNFGSNVINCYNSGDVSSSNSCAGGISGFNQTGVYSYCYWNIDSKQTANGVSLANANKRRIGNITGIVGSKTAVEMRDVSFVNLLNSNKGEGAAWTLDTLNINGGYPVFEYQYIFKNLIEIVITTPPDKISYVEGEDIDLTGLIVIAYYDDGTSETIADYQISGYDSTPGTKTITVAYEGESDSFEVTVATQTRILNITTPTFTAVTYGYTRPNAAALIIQNSGNSLANISSVTLTSGDITAFEISGGGVTVATGESIDTWTVQPKAELPIKTYTATITINYDDSATATANVNFTVNAALPPEILNVTTNGTDSITVNTNRPQQPAILIVAVYGGDKLLNVKIETILLSDDMTVNINIPVNSDKIKVMMWDSIDTFQPLCPPKALITNGGAWNLE